MSNTTRAIAKHHNLRQDSQSIIGPKTQSVEFTILLLTLNEGENLKLLLPSVLKTMHALSVSFEVLIIDGGSQDSTQEIVNQHRVRFYKQNQPGYAAAFKEGVQQARGHWIINLDADNSHPVEVIPSLVEESRKTNTDLVIASRFISNNETPLATFRTSLSYLLSNICRLIMGTQISDWSSGYRLYKRSAIKTESLNGEDFSILLSVLCQIITQGGSVREIPFTYQQRAFGKSHVRYGAFFLSYLRTLLLLSSMSLTKRLHYNWGQLCN